MKIDIVLASDEKFAIPCMITITSILENNKDYECHIYVFNTGYTDSTKDKFKQLSFHYGREIELIEVSTAKLEGLNINPIYSIVTYFRFLIPEILNDCDKCIYLDSDVIVRHTLEEFWNTNIDYVACAVIGDQNADNVLEGNRLRIENLHYFNAGVLLMNLNYWRKNNLCTKLITELTDHKDEYIYNDQDAMNALLYQNVVFVSFKYNFQNGLYFKNRFVSYKYWGDIDESMSDPVIIHYCYAIKPWHTNCEHPAKQEFLKYANLHPFIGFKAKHYHSILYRIVHLLFIRTGKSLLKYLKK